jgi:hypothetical protein
VFHAELLNGSAVLSFLFQVVEELNGVGRDLIERDVIAAVFLLTGDGAVAD